jgi:hypothetical protein
LSKKAEPKTRIIEVAMKFYKVFYIEVPEGVTEDDVRECEMVDDETSCPSVDVEFEFDEILTHDEGHKTADEIAALKRHEAVFSWQEALGEA